MAYLTRKSNKPPVCQYAHTILHHGSLFAYNFSIVFASYKRSYCSVTTTVFSYEVSQQEKSHKHELKLQYAHLPFTTKSYHAWISVPTPDRGLNCFGSKKNSYAHLHLMRHTNIYIIH